MIDWRFALGFAVLLIPVGIVWAIAAHDAQLMLLPGSWLLIAGILDVIDRA